MCSQSNDYSSWGSPLEPWYSFNLLVNKCYSRKLTFCLCWCVLKESTEHGRFLLPWNLHQALLFLQTLHLASLSKPISKQTAFCNSQILYWSVQSTCCHLFCTPVLLMSLCMVELLGLVSTSEARLSECSSFTRTTSGQTSSSLRWLFLTFVCYNSILAAMPDLWHKTVFHEFDLFFSQF